MQFKKIKYSLLALLIIISVVFSSELSSHAAGIGNGGLYWNKYSSDFYKTYLNIPQKKLYDKLYDTCMKYLLDESEIPAVVSKNNADYYLPYMEANGLGSDEAKAVVALFAASNPQFYFVSGTKFLHSTKDNNYFVTTNIYKEYIDGATRKEATAVIKAKLEEWVKTVSVYEQPIDREKAIYELVAKNLDYDKESTANPISLEKHQSIATAVLTGKTVCTGYAEVFGMLCTAVGIECIAVVSQDHEWNRVKIGENWYNVDITWGDSGDKASYKYFNISDESISKMDTNHVPHKYFETYIPKCPRDFEK